MRRCTLASSTNERLWPGVAGWWHNLSGQSSQDTPSYDAQIRASSQLGQKRFLLLARFRPFRKLLLPIFFSWRLPTGVHTHVARCLKFVSQPGVSLFLFHT